MKHRAYIIGIAGGSASGKTTLSSFLCNCLNEIGIRVTVVSMDSYYFPEEKLPRVKGCVDEGKIYLDYNHPDSFDVELLNRDIDSFRSSDEFDVIIVEGLLVLHEKDILKKLDLKVFVDCSADERIVRRIRRNMKWGHTFDNIADVYIDLVRFRHDEYVEPTKRAADIIINGSMPFDKPCDILVEYLKRTVQS